MTGRAAGFPAHQGRELVLRPWLFLAKIARPAGSRGRARQGRGSAAGQASAGHCSLFCLFR